MRTGLSGKRSALATLKATLLVSLLATLLITIASQGVASAQAQVTCWSISDGAADGDADTLVRIDDALGTPNPTNLGTLPTTDAEAMAIRPGTDDSFLWVWDTADGLDIINASTRAATDASFSVGPTKIAGMTWVNTNDADLTNDQLFVIRSSGAVQGYNLNGATVYSATSALVGAADQGEDIAWDPATGDLLAAVSVTATSATTLVRVSPVAGGTPTDLTGSESDLEGLGFTSDGQLIGTTGNAGTNTLYSLNKANGDVLSSLLDLSTDPGTVAHASVDCVSSTLGGDSTPAPTITSPAAGSTLACGDVVLTWTGASDEYWVYAGSTEGGNDYYDSTSLGAATTTTISGLPEDSSTVNVRLFYRDTGGTWATLDTTYTACAVVGPVATITAPAANSTLACGNITASWSGTADEYWVFAGSTFGGNDYYDSGNIAGATSTTVTGLPDDSSVVYIRLFYRAAAGQWLSTDVLVTACDEPAPTATITTPLAGTTLACGDTAVTWTGDADQYWVYAGSTPGGNEHFDSGSLGGALTATMTNLPSDGATVYVRLWYRFTDAEWLSADIQYTACSATATITSPLAGAVLDCVEDAVSWTGTADEYWIYAGSAAGGNDYYDSGNLGGATTTTMTGLPIDGATPVNVRLWFRNTNGPWLSTDITYVACTAEDPTATITSPAPDGELDCDFDVLTWTGTATEYWVYAGSSVGGNDYYDSGNLGDVSNATITNLPNEGLPVFVRLWFRAPTSGWLYTDIAYTACAPAVAIISPALGATLACGDTALSWMTTDVQWDEYWVYAGSTEGGSDYFNSGSVGNATTATMTGLPTDGSTVYVRVWFRNADTAWSISSVTDVTYIGCVPLVLTPTITQTCADGVGAIDVNLAYTGGNVEASYTIDVTGQDARSGTLGAGDTVDESYAALGDGDYTVTITDTTFGQTPVTTQTVSVLCASGVSAAAVGNCANLAGGAIDVTLSNQSLGAVDFEVQATGQADMVVNNVLPGVTQLVRIPSAGELGNGVYSVAVLADDVSIFSSDITINCGSNPTAALGAISCSGVSGLNTQATVTFDNSAVPIATDFVLTVSGTASTFNIPAGETLTVPVGTPSLGNYPITVATSGGISLLNEVIQVTELCFTATATGFCDFQNLNKIRIEFDNNTSGAVTAVATVNPGGVNLVQAIPANFLTTITLPETFADGTYTITIDVSGVPVQLNPTQTVTLACDAEPGVAAASLGSVTCAADGTGTVPLTLTVDGGNQAFDFTVTIDGTALPVATVAANGTSTLTLGPLANGNHSVSVVAGGVTLLNQAAVGVCNVAGFPEASTSAVTCNVENDGAIIGGGFFSVILTVVGGNQSENFIVTINGNPFPTVTVAGNTSETLDFGPLPNNTYVVTVTTDNGTVLNRALVVGCTSTTASHVTSCTAANLGQISANYINASGSTAVFETTATGPGSATVGATVIAGSTGSSGASAGLPDGNYTVVTTADGVTILSEQITLNCNWSITINDSCLSGMGVIEAVVANPTASDITVVLKVTGLNDKSTVVPAGTTQTIRRTGRPNGVYLVEVDVDGNNAASQTVLVIC